MVDLWSKFPIQTLCPIFKPIPMQNFTFSEVPNYFYYFYSLLLFFFQIGKGIRYWKNNRGLLFTAPAQHCDDPGPIQCMKPSHVVFLLGTLPSGHQRLPDPTRQPHSFTGGDRYAVDPILCPLPSKPVPFLRFGTAGHCQPNVPCLASHALHSSRCIDAHHSPCRPVVSSHALMH
jgi:hypothetical protein